MSPIPLDPLIHVVKARCSAFVGVARLLNDHTLLYTAAASQSHCGSLFLKQEQDHDTRSKDILQLGTEQPLVDGLLDFFISRCANAKVALHALGCFFSYLSFNLSFVSEVSECYSRVGFFFSLYICVDDFYLVREWEILFLHKCRHATMDKQRQETVP